MLDECNEEIMDINLENDVEIMDVDMYKSS